MDYEQIFCDILWKNLKPKIRGKIYVDVIMDVLRVDINYEGISWSYAINDFAKLILYGLCVDEVVYKVVTEYRKYLYRRIDEVYFW